MARRAPRGSPRRYPRTARLNELLREIIAGRLEAIDDERLGLLTVVAVETDQDLNNARVHWTRIGDDMDDDEVNAILESYRSDLQRTINRQTDLRRTPIISFQPDAISRAAARVDEILRDIDAPGPDGVDPEAG